MATTTLRLALAVVATTALHWSASTVDAKVPLAMGTNSNESWIDPETAAEFHTMRVPAAGGYRIGANASHHEFTLIFSDEFNDSTRSFEAGFDRKWTAIDILDTTNMGQHYFLPQATQIDDGNLKITTTKPKKKYRGASYVSGSMQTWNKFCFTGGFIEVRAILPGKWGIPGTWPAIWIMGNLGRAAFLGSQEGTWPWSFDACAPYVEKAEKVDQKISACGNLTDKHDDNSFPETFGLNPFQGRGATEIDVIEAQIRARDEPAFISTSLQIRPSLYPNMRPDPGSLPQPNQWYQGLKFGENTNINSDYYGEMGLDSLSALTQLETNAFLSYHLYQLDWSPGPEGHIRWWMDGNFLFEIPGAALNAWSDGIPPRQVPVEPSYLILSTAVSEKFSPPCDGQICDSLWPSNFTIDYVRVYQGNPNRYTSVGCNPKGFPTSSWIAAHPVDYGLPWYVSLQVETGLTNLFALLNGGISLVIVFYGFKHPVLTTAYVSTLWLIASFYGVFSISSLDGEVLWIHVFIACVCGVVLGGVLSLVCGAALGAMLGLYFGAAIGQFLPLLAARILVAVLVLTGVGLSLLSRVNQKHLLVISTSCIGSVGFVMSLSLWTTKSEIAVNLWNLAGYILGGSGYTSTHICSQHCATLYSILATLSVGGALFQYYTTRSVSSVLFKKKAAKPFLPAISASSDARAWKPEDSNAEKVNFFSPLTLPRNMQQYAVIFRIAMNVQRSYGFQLDSFRNQTEHIVMLLANSSRKGGNPYRKLHDLVFSNYSKWCRKLEIPSQAWSESRKPQANVLGLTSVDEISIDLCLFFFIWGEASNARHSPEFLCFLFHKMKEEFPSVRNIEREAGYFLDTVITPVYGLLKTHMNSNHDHRDRHNYDDFNEFFWSTACLQYDYKHEDVIEMNSPNPMAYFKQKRDGSNHGGGLAGGHRSGFGHSGSSSHGSMQQKKRKSIAEGFAESSKSFLEKRTWLAPLRAFSRVFDFHVIAFHFLAALAFANEQELDFADGAKIVSSTLITPFLLSILRDGLDIFAVYDEHATSSSMGRHVVRILFHLALSVLSLSLYWYAWRFGGEWWTTFYATLLFLHIPGFFNCVLQVVPQLNNWLRRTRFKPVAIIRDIINPMNRLYVGDNVLDPASASFGYQFFWSTMLFWKLFFSYKFEIRPLVVPSFLLYADHMESNVSIVTTSFLIFLNWFPFFLVFCVDITIWNAIWVAFTGTFVGFSSHIGEIRNFGRVRAAFSRAADVFNAKIIASNSKTGLEIADTVAANATYGSTNVFGHEVLDRMPGDAAASTTAAVNLLNNRNHQTSSSSVNDETPLLSFSRRKQTATELKNQRRQKWFSFSVAWDTIIEAMRGDDLISNHEMSILRFQRLHGYQREIYLPQFQLAGCYENFTSSILDMYAQERDISERLLQDKLLELLGENPMVEEAVEEIWELANWVLINILGPCHTNDVRYICSTLNSWAARGVFRALNMKNVATTGRALADLLSLLKSNLGAWKSNAKFVPVRKNPSDYSSFQFPQQQSSAYRPVSSGMTKSASTTGLSSLGGTVPRRSRGSGVARIAALQQTAKPKDNKGKVTHSIPSAHIMQIRDRLRTFLNLAKSMIRQVDERDPIYAETKGISDRLTWILTQERGFMWDDDYTGEQVTLTAFESHADVIVKHLHGLLTLQKIDAEPRSYDARRRLLFFVNSLFMDMPLAPLLEEMKSWSVMTPFYGEDVLYSKSDLESKQDGLDVHTLLFLQTLYKQDWENFLERVKPKKNFWKDPHTAIELRLWASLRGQTLTRTVQGMMYGEAAIRLLAEIEQVPVERIEELIKTKFTYVVACQIYGRQKRNNDPKARDIDFLLHRFPNLRVSYIDEVRVNYQKEQSYFTVLVKGSESLGTVEEVYRVRLPGNPILGEGKPENQNAAIVFTRGENLQTIDMNQDGYIEESLKMRNMLEEFDSGTPDRPYTIVGLPEHIFTGSVSSLANYMALQETSFVTLGQRTLARPLRVRLHYGHPDVFNKLFFITRGGISKASKGINLSEDIFAGYNNCLRGGSVTFPEYVKCGKGRDVGMQQIYKFEAKLAQGAAEQSLSRDVYRISQRLDFFKLLSFYYNHVGFYLSMSMIIWTVYILLYCNLLRALLSLEGVGGRTPVLLSQLQMMLGSVAFFTTAPLLATISVERGFKAALKEVFMIFVTGGPLYFLFHIGTKWFYYGQTILAGGAKYRATGRGFVTKHSRFDELYRFYASSHLYSGVEIAVGLSIYYIFTIGEQYFAMTWSLWLVVLSWYFSPFWFNPLAFEWSDVIEDWRVWLKWMRGDGGNANQSWEAWFKEENAYFSTLRPWAKIVVTMKGLLFTVIALSIVSAYEPYHSLLTESTWLPFAICLSIAALYLSVSALFVNSSRGYGENGLVRFMKLILVLVCAASLVVAFVFVNGMWQCVLSMGYLIAAAGCWGLLLFGANSRFVQNIYFLHDMFLGVFSLSLILFLSALYVPGKIQTWLLYNNALSRGVVIEDILRTNSRNDDREDELSAQQMRTIIVEQQRMISALTANSSSGDLHHKSGDEHLQHTLSDNTLSHLRNVSETELSALQDASIRLQALVQQESRRPTAQQNGGNGENGAPVSSLMRSRRAYSTNDFSDPSTLLSFGGGDKSHNGLPCGAPHILDLLPSTNETKPDEQRISPPASSSPKAISMWLRRSLPTLARHTRVNQRSCLQSAALAVREFSTPAVTADLIRNVAIVAHVDHGKTTLVDQLLKHGGNMLSEDRVMDSIDLERERGITIMSKCTRVEYNGHVLNIVDTPGHSDFGGEVERILSMVDGVVLVVDATEGPMSQTKFVLTKALNRGLKPLVVINKVDRETSRLNGDVENELFDMFVALEADDDQLEFPVLYASAKQGWAVRNLDDADEKRDSMTALLDEIIKYVPAPVADATAPFAMAVTMIGHDSYVGRLATGRIHAGTAKIGDAIKVLNLESKQLETGKITKMYVTRGTAKSEVTSATAGDIVTIAGVNAFVSDTVCDAAVSEPIPSPTLDPPTISMTFGVNDSPIAGKEGKFLTSSHIKERLKRETENNVAISVSQSESSEAFNVHGRGELQLAILIEEMRREGFEMCVSAPQVLFKTCPDTKQRLEPIEEVTIDVDADYSGSVIDKLSNRGGEIVEFKEMQDKVRLQFKIPSRCLMGYRSEIKTDTRGSGVLNSIFHGYSPFQGSASAPSKGKLIASANGVATAYALNTLEDRGEMFVKPGDEVYTGMIIGEHNRPVDIEVNPTKEKKLTNMRAAGNDEAIRLAPIRTMSLEDVVTYIGEDEMIDVSPTRIRMRKRELSANDRKRSATKKK